jgi:hypothetical protein
VFRKHIEEVKAQVAVAERADQLAPGNAGSSPRKRAMSEEKVARKLSTFIGNTSSDLDQKQEKSSCKLCLRPFTLFRWRSKCSWCGDSTCNECSSHSVRLPHVKENTERRVCDGCYGVIEGFLPTDLKL